MFVYLVIAAVAWGTGGAVASLLYQESGLGPVAVSFWRFVIGAALLAAFVHSRTLATRPSRVFGCRAGRGASVPAGSAPKDATGCAAGGGAGGPAGSAPKDATGRAALLGLGMAISQTAYFAAVGRSGVAVATVITLGVCPLLVAIGERLLLAERVSRWQGVILVLAIGGLCLLVLAGGGGQAQASVNGVVLALLSGVTYAGVILVQRASGSGADPYRGALASFAIGAVCLLPLALLEGIVPTRGAAPTITMLVYLGAVPTALAYGLFFAALGQVKATTASVVALLEPVTAAAIGVTLLHERLTLVAATGALVLLLAVACYPVLGDRLR